MRAPIRIFIFLVLIGCAVMFGRLFYSLYAKVEVLAPGTTLAVGAIFLLSVLGLSLMTAHEAAQFIGSLGERFFYRNLGEGIMDPEYDRAERVWADGRYLDAIGLMRDYLKKNPHELHVSLRIAEIYEKDLNNPVAAVLEYEEVLQHHLPSERWGWAAIHLANLYSGKLNRTEDAIALLHRIVEEHGRTAAARKARERLGISEPEPGAETEEGAAAQETSPAAQPEAPTHKLPPGFRPKKK